MTDTAPPPRPMALAEFEALVGQMFDLDCDPKSIAIRLIEASPERNIDTGPKEPFTLIFHSTPDILLVDGIYVMRCGSLGPASIHIGNIAAPIGAPPGHYYQAIFN